LSEHSQKSKNGFEGLEIGEKGEDFFQKFHTKMEGKRDNWGERIPYFF
jgi:hypothetical protein